MPKTYVLSLTIFVALLVSLPNMADPADVKVSASGWSTKHSRTEPAMRTTVMQLLTNPAQFDRHAVRVVGVLSIDFEDHRLYFSKEFYDAFFPQYALELKLPSGALAASARFQGKYVMVEGTFTTRVDALSTTGSIDVTLLEVAEEPRRSRTK